MNKLSIKDYIRNRLFEIAKIHNVKIILAVESGSRAWGYPSVDSDYDVRFIYVHNIAHYLSIDQKRDVIETEIEYSDHLKADFDVNGWDLKKVLQLALKGNAVVSEWLTSPIVYLKEEIMYEKLSSFIHKTANLTSYLYFYKNYMPLPIESFLSDRPDIKVKEYCYLMRSALAIKWIETFKSPPPMDVPSMVSKLDLDNNILSEIMALISFKKLSIEKDMIKRSIMLDNFISQSRNVIAQKPTKEFSNQKYLDIANGLFRSIVMDVTSQELRSDK